MNYLYNFIKTLTTTTALIACLGLSVHILDRGEIVAQNITVEYLERILIDLKAEGVVPDDATLCDVDWLQYGIVVRLDCKSRIRSLRSAKPDASALPRKQDPTPAPQIIGDARIDCNLLRVNFPDLCESIRAETYSRNLAAPWAVGAGDICSAVIGILHIENSAGGIVCPRNVFVSEIMLGGGISGGRGETAQVEAPFAHISVQRGPSDPPVFSITMIGSPSTLDGMNGQNFFERVDFLLFWTFEQNGEFEVKVQPLLVLQGQIGSSINEMRQVKAAERFGQITGSVRRSRVRPTFIASKISDTVQ